MSRCLRNFEKLILVPETPDKAQGYRYPKSWEIFEHSKAYHNDNPSPCPKLLVHLISMLLYPFIWVVTFVRRSLTSAGSQSGGRLPHGAERDDASGVSSRGSTVRSDCRAIAIWIVYVPYSHLHCRGGIVKGLLLPSRSPMFQSTLQLTLRTSGEVIEPISRELEDVTALLHKLHAERRGTLARFRTTPSAEEESDPLLCGKIIRDHLDVYHTLQAHETYLKSKVAEVKLKAKTMANVDKTGWSGVAHWASETYSEYSDLLQLITTVAFVGAGLTYSTIFGATRGNLGLISWSFTLFTVCLVISLVMQSLLSWCKAQDNTIPFVTTTLWTLITRIAVVLSCLSLTGAVTLLCITIIQLNFGAATSTASGANVASVAAPGVLFKDAPLAFYVSPNTAGVTSLAAVGVGFGAVSFVLVSFALAKAFKIVNWRQRGKLSRTSLKSLDV